MPLEKPKSITPDVAVPRDITPVPARFFRGPDAYIARTPWSAWAGSAAAVGIFLGAVVAVTIVVIIAWAKNHNPTEVFVTIASTLVQQIAIICLTWYAAVLYGGKPVEVLALHPPAQGWKAYPIAFALLIALTLIMNFTIQAFDAGVGKEDVAIYRDMMKSTWWWLALVIVGIGAPVSEELLCRGFLFSALASSRLGKAGAAVITSAAFAIAHPYSIVGVAQVFLIGVLFAWMLIRTGSLRVTMVCHAVFNTAMAILMLANLDG